MVSRTSKLTKLVCGFLVTIASCQLPPCYDKKNRGGLSAFKSALKHTENISKHASLGICRSWRQHWCETVGRLPWICTEEQRQPWMGKKEKERDDSDERVKGKATRDPDGVRCHAALETYRGGVNAGRLSRALADFVGRH